MAYELGDTVERKVVITDSSGTAVDPDSTPTYSITLPDGTAGIAPAVAQASTGNYFVLYPTVNAGLHQDRWDATVSGVDVVVQDSFRVRSLTLAPMLPLSEIREMLGLGVDPIRDEKLRTTVDAAATLIENRTGYKYRRRTVTNETHYGGRDRLVFRSPPVISVTSLTDNDVAVPGTSYEVDYHAGILWSKVGTFNGIVKVTYVCGYTEIPEDVLECCRELVSIMWAWRYGATGTPRRAAGNEGPARTIESTLAKLTDMAPVIA